MVVKGQYTKGGNNISSIVCVGKYTPKSAILKCKCGVRGWHTKNIDYIGARTIYSFGGGCNWMKSKMTCSWKECDCPPADLEVDMELIEHVMTCKECMEYGL